MFTKQKLLLYTKSILYTLSIFGLMFVVLAIIATPKSIVRPPYEPILLVLLVLSFQAIPTIFITLGVAFVAQLFKSPDGIFIRGVALSSLVGTLIVFAVLPYFKIYPSNDLSMVCAGVSISGSIIGAFLLLGDLFWRRMHAHKKSVDSQE